MTEPTGRLRKFIPRPSRYAELHGNFSLTDRDVEILATVYRYRYLEARHIRALVAGSDQQITRRLQGLFHTGYLGRYVPHGRMRADLDPGPPIMAYGIESRGFQALQERRASMLAEEPARWNRSHTRRARWFLRHRLLQSQFRCVLEMAIRDSDYRLTDWSEGESVRVRVPLPGSRQRRVGLEPDARFTIAMSDRQRQVFLEIDRGTEELPRLVRKYRAYWWYLQSDEYRLARTGRLRTTVLFVTTGEKRLRNMVNALREMPKPNRVMHGGKGQFWFGCHDWYSLAHPTALFWVEWRTVSATGTSQLSV